MLFQLTWLLCIGLISRVEATVQDSANTLASMMSSQSFDSTLLRCSATCAGLFILFPQQVDYFNSTDYNNEQLHYWSEQQQTTYPRCRFTPFEAIDVSVAVILSRATQCQFAVKSGGHAAFVGASNIKDGLAIDLQNMTTIKVSADKTLTQVGAGNRWTNVYAALDKLNLAVVGGRNSDVGVGGLTLGGGISYFSGYYGWALDNVRNYEVVIATGQILNVNYTSYPDLYWALRGGGNNFGIVTRFDLETFKQGNMWGGQTIYPLSTNASQYNAFYWFNENANQDPNAAIIVAAACVPNQGCFFSNDYEYSQPVSNPAIFKNFTSIANLTSSNRITRLGDLTDELAATQPPGFRQMFVTCTFKNNVKLLQDVLNIWYAKIQPLITSVPDFLPSNVVQPVTSRIVSQMQRNGGNALGISPSDGNLVVFNMDFQWSGTENDNLVIGTITDILNQAINLAKQRNLFHRYIYQNYAGNFQDVFAGYGSTNRAKLQSISQKYDPTGVFQRLQPGYFKVST